MILFEGMSRSKKSPKIELRLEHEEDCWCAFCTAAQYFGLIHGDWNGAMVVFPVFEEEFIRDTKDDDEEDEGREYLMDRPAMPIMYDDETGVLILSDPYPIKSH